jgi:peptidoglycan/LPS O-acetylase OafA/YrhL
MKLAYRPEIDGMRTVAVLSVIVYHLKITIAEAKLLPGGFLGVDLFFVLSGYLITGIILAELHETGRFGIRNFYMRRARRILPPLLLVMLAAIPVAWAILTPTQLESFGGSLVASLGFASNVFWYYEQGAYGASSALLNPFLHTWSLAIEEQYYLLFPLGLAFLHRKRPEWVGPALVLGIVLSLAAAQILTMKKADLSFYSPTSRAWEMLAGSALAFAQTRTPQALKGLPGARMLASAGLVVLLVCIAITDLAATAHPGIATIPVILATCAMIWFADPRDPATRLMSSRPFVAIGKLSYSLYLWHFPIFAFGRLISIDAPGPADWAVWLILTFACTVAGYHLIEKPFRFRLAARPFALATGAATAVAIAFSAGVYAGGGWPDRLSARAALFAPSSYDNEALQTMSWSVLDALAPQEKIDNWNAHGPSRNEAERLWFKDPDATHVLVIGNSHANDAFNALYLNADLFAGMEFARFGLRGDIPQDQFQELLASPNFEAADVLAMAPAFNMEQLPAFRHAVKRLLGAGKRIVLFDNIAEFHSVNNRPLFDWWVLSHDGALDVGAINALGHARESQRPDEANAALHAFAAENGLTIYSRRALICDDAAASCALSTPEGYKTMYDYGHWTLEGAKFFGARMAERGWLR